MFGALMAAAPAKRAQPETPSGMLSSDGARLYINGNELPPHEVRKILPNAGIVSNYKTGNIMLITGACAFLIGGVVFLTKPNVIFNNHLDNGEDRSLGTLGLVFGGIGLCVGVTGCIMKINAKRAINNAVDTYNARQYPTQATLQLTPTRHGLGLVYTF
jgi:hypothetical protein